MKLKILAFGASQDILKSKSVTISVNAESITIADLKLLLIDFYPGLSELASFMIAVNGEYTYDQAINIVSGDELAIIPPTSGG